MFQIQETSQALSTENFDKNTRKFEGFKRFSIWTHFLSFINQIFFKAGPRKDVNVTMNGQLATKAALIYDPLSPMPRTADSIQFMEPVFNDPKIGEDGTCTVRFQVLIPDSVNPQPERKWYVNDQAGFQIDSLRSPSDWLTRGRN